MQSTRLGVIDSLRGLAAFAVMWYHFTNREMFRGAGSFNWTIRTSGIYGWLGVEVFFVLSGLLIPYTMMRSSYRISEYFRHLVRRLKRLEPPYLAAIALTLALWYAGSLSSVYSGAPFAFEPLQFISNVTHSCALTGTSWYNPVFWTLAIEVQFYIGIGLLLPLLTRLNQAQLSASLLLLSLLACCSRNESLIVSWLGIFAIGMAGCMRLAGRLSAQVFWPLAIAITAINWFISGGIVAATAAATLLAILTAPNFQIRVLSYLGIISYSLFLVHVPVGTRLLRLGARFVDSDFGMALLLLVVVLVTVGASVVFYRLVEKPAHNWAAQRVAGFDPAPKQ